MTVVEAVGFEAELVDRREVRGQTKPFGVELDEAIGVSRVGDFGKQHIDRIWVARRSIAGGVETEKGVNMVGIRKAATSQG